MVGKNSRRSSLEETAILRTAVKGGRKNMAHYTTVRKTAERLELSERRIQALCHEGRIPGAIFLSGIWMIPDNAAKPSDLRKERPLHSANSEQQMSLFDFMKGETIFDLKEACEFLGISAATGNNWMKSGRLVPSLMANNKPLFRIDDLRILLGKLSLSDNNSLKSRRNKSQISGISAYADYLNCENDAAARNMERIRRMVELSKDDPDIDELIPIVMAEYVLRFFVAAGHIDLPEKNSLPTLKAYFNDELELGVYEPLVEDFFTIESNLTGSADSVLEELLKFPLEFIPGQDVLGLIYISLKSLRDRKATGTYYTPDFIVHNLADNAGERLPEGTTDRADYLDPCCGTGNFLLALQKKGISPEHLYGKDNDRLSVMLARVNLILNTSPESARELIPVILKQISCTDTLLEDFPENDRSLRPDSAGIDSMNRFITGEYPRFDVIIGNPPWGFSYSNEYTKQIKKYYKSADGKTIESFRLFLEYGLSHLTQNGVLAFVLPESFLNVVSHAKIRRLLAEQAYVASVTYRPDGFKNVVCPAIELIAVMSPCEQIDISTPDRKFTIPSERCSVLNADGPWNLSVDNMEYRLLEYLETFSPAIRLNNGSADYCLGIVTGNNAGLLTTKKSNGRDGLEPILKGSEIFRFRHAEAENRIVFAPGSFQQCAPEKYYRTPSKLIYRFICNRPVFAYDDCGTLTLNSANILINNVDLLDDFFLLGILNSSVVQYYLTNKYHSVKLLRSHIESIPIPFVSAEEQQPLIEAVKEIMACSDPESALECYRRINHLVYGLYRLDEFMILRIERDLIYEKEVSYL